MLKWIIKLLDKATGNSSRNEKIHFNKEGDFVYGKKREV